MLKKKYQQIKLIIYDFDGVMTNNKFILDSNGEESVILNRGDGLGISLFKKIGIKQIILSTEKNKIVKIRAQKVGIQCFYGIENKKNFLINFIKINKLKFNEICYIGNDLNDLEAMLLCKFAFCPLDAVKKIKIISNKTLTSKGGEGVVRELFDYLTK